VSTGKPVTFGVVVGFVVAFALLAAPAGARPKGKAKARTKADTVALAFGWPDGLVARITHDWTRTSPGKPTASESMTARLVVAAEGQTFRVAFRDWQVPAGGTPAPSLNKLSAVVDKEGTLIRIDGKVAPAEALSLAGGREKAADILPVLIQQSAENTWQTLVGTWAGGELELGAEYETDEEVPSPLVPGATLKTKLRFGVERRLPCPGGATRSCVELKLHSEPDPASLRKLVEKVGAKFGTKGLGDVGQLGVTQDFTLVTEPEGLIPHRLEIVKTVEVRAAPPTESGRQVDRTLWTFTYAPANARPASK
jgi:hypothetical protein